MSNVNGYKWIRPEKRALIYARDLWRCLWCGRNVKQKTRGDDNATLDHFLPREAGGTNAADNLLTSCMRCNARRQDRRALDFVPDLATLDHIISQLLTPIATKPRAVKPGKPRRSRKPPEANLAGISGEAATQDLYGDPQ